MSVLHIAGISSDRDTVYINSTGIPESIADAASVLSISGVTHIHASTVITMNRVFDRALAIRAFTSQTICPAVRPPPLSHPGPLPLPAEDQHEFEELVKQAARTAHSAESGSVSASAHNINNDGGIHPDARRGPEPEFVGDVNPNTGERGGPKREPVRPNSDWSFGGRVTDF
jgi:hypothetical protein